MILSVYWFTLRLVDFFFYITALLICRVGGGAQLQSSPGEESSDEVSSRRNHHHQQQQHHHQRVGREARNNDDDDDDDRQSFVSSKPLSVLHRRRVLLRVAGDTLHTTAAVNARAAELTTSCRSQTTGGGEMIRLAGGIQSTRSATDEDEDLVAAVVERSPSDDCEGTDTGCLSTSPSPRRRACPKITVPVEHSPELTPPSPKPNVDDVFHAVPRSILTVASCLMVDGRPSLSSSIDAPTESTRYNV